jgi:hypothetical protein
MAGHETKKTPYYMTSSLGDSKKKSEARWAEMQGIRVLLARVNLFGFLYPTRLWHSRQPITY